MNAESLRGEEDETSKESRIPAKSISLHDHLLHQIGCLPLDHQTRLMCERLLEWLDADGRLSSPLEELAQSTGWEFAQLEEALRLIQHLDPAGVGARSLAECLLIQLSTRHLQGSLAAEILRDHFDLLVKRKFQLLAGRLQVEIADVQAAYQMIQGLDPKPARNFGGESPTARVPDLIVRSDAEGFEVEVNDEDLPRLVLNRGYVALLKDPSKPEEAKQFIREKMQQGTWLIKAITQRRSTLLSIGRCLVKLEQEFLIYGMPQIKTFTQEEVARMVGCHPSTISRAIAGKTMQTPFGILPLEYFFGGGISVSEAAGNRISSKQIQAEIESMIAQEPPSKPLSDSAIAEALLAKNYPVARRTVAKYRAQMHILPAHLRRSLENSPSTSAPVLPNGEETPSPQR